MPPGQDLYCSTCLYPAEQAEFPSGSLLGCIQCSLAEDQGDAPWPAFIMFKVQAVLSRQPWTLAARAAAAGHHSSPC